MDLQVGKINLRAGIKPAPTRENNKRIGEKAAYKGIAQRLFPVGAGFTPARVTHSRSQQDD